jgi:hypothetical protein
MGGARFATMRDVTVQLERPTRRPGREQDAPVAVLRSPFTSGAVAAVWAAAIGMVVVCTPVLLAWWVAPHGPGVGLGAPAAVPATDALRGAVLAWLAAQHATIHTSVGSLSLVPLGLVAVPAFALYRCGRWAGRVSVDAVPAGIAATGSLAVAYTVATAVVSSLASDSQLGATTGSLLAGSLALAVVAGGLGVVVGGRLWADLAARAPESMPHVVRGALAGLATVLCGGGVILVASMLAHAGRMLDLTRGLGAGALGGAVLLLVGALCVPTAVVWAACYAVGPGFAVGIGTSVAPAGIALGPVPAFPLLAVLPGTGHAPAVSLVALAVPVAAGVVIGLMAARRPAATPGRTVGEAAAAGALAGVALGVLAWLTSGSLGAVRMSQLGPHGGAVGAVAALELAVVAAAVAWEVDRHAAGFARAGARLRSAADIVRHRGRPRSTRRRARLWRR